VSVVSPIQTPPSGPPPAQPYPWRIGLGLVVVVLIVAGLFYALMERTRGPATGDHFPAPATATALAERVAATAAAVPTEAPAAQPTALSATQPTAAVAPTAPAVVQTTPRLAPTPIAPATAAAPATATTGATAVATALPTVDAALDKEISDAYLHYFQVRSEALLYLDPTVLEAVAADVALEGLRKDIEQQRAEGRALRTNVVHSFDVVRLQGDGSDTVSIIDHYKDLSVWVDPTTLDPLPGQLVPASPDVAPQVNVVYHLHRIDGVWKVVGGDRYVP